MANESSFTTENGDRPDAVDICVLITDGKPTVGGTPGAIAALEARGIHLLVLVVGDPDVVTRLGLQRSDPRVMVLGNYSALASLTSALNDLICTIAGQAIAQFFLT